MYTHYCNCFDFVHTLYMVVYTCSMYICMTPTYSITEWCVVVVGAGFDRLTHQMLTVSAGTPKTQHC